MSHVSLSTRGAANGSTGLLQARQILDRTRLAPPAAQDDFRGGNLADVCSVFHRSRDILKLPFPDLVVSKRKLRLADAIACVRMKRQEANQSRVHIPTVRLVRTARKAAAGRTSAS